MFIKCHKYNYWTILQLFAYLSAFPWRDSVWSVLRRNRINCWDSLTSIQQSFRSCRTCSFEVDINQLMEARSFKMGIKQAGMWRRLPVVAMSLYELNPRFSQWRIFFRKFMHWSSYNGRIIFATSLIWATGYAIFAKIVIFFSGLYGSVFACFGHDGLHASKTTTCDVIGHVDRAACTETFSEELACLR